MKKILFFILLLILLSNQVIGQADLYEACTNDWEGPCMSSPISNIIDVIDCNRPWELVFEDDFDTWDPTKYYTCFDGWDRQHGSGELQYYSENNVTVADGKLILTAKYEPGDYPVWDFSQGLPGTLVPKHFDYTSGMIQIQEPKTFNFGRFEIMCKLPYGKGFWPAFWLYRDDGTYNEIDIFEFYNNNTWDMTAHYEVYNDGNVWTWPVYPSYDGASFCSVPHKFTLEWDEFNIKWYLDDVLKRTIPRYYIYENDGTLNNACNSNPPYFNGLEELIFPKNPMAVIINFAIANGPTDLSDFPSTLEIDYIKIWQHSCCIPNKYYEATENLPAVTQVSDFIVAGNDVGIQNASGDVTVKSGQNVTFHAGEYIDLLPGFTVEPGAEFTAETQDCNLNNSGGDEIVITNFPSEFTDKMLVWVNGATSYTIRVDGVLPPYNTYYFAEDMLINSNPVNVWDGTCNQNCGWYNECDKDRTITIKFMNCDHELTQQKDVHVNCSSAKIINDSLGDDSILTKQINETERNLYFLLSPNPCSDYASISYSTSQGENLLIVFFNYTGSKIGEYNLQGGINNKTIDMSNFSDGIYSYQVYFGNKLFKTDKIVIIK